MHLKVCFRLFAFRSGVWKDQFDRKQLTRKWKCRTWKAGLVWYYLNKFDRNAETKLDRGNFGSAISSRESDDEIDARQRAKAIMNSTLWFTWCWMRHRAKSRSHSKVSKCPEWTGRSREFLRAINPSWQCKLIRFCKKSEKMNGSDQRKRNAKITQSEI